MPVKGSAVTLKKFFSTEENPCLNAEFTEFWETLTDAEKADYKQQLEEIENQ